MCALPCCACVVSVVVVVWVVVVVDARLRGSVASVVLVAVLMLVRCVGACGWWVLVGVGVGAAPVVGGLSC